MTAPLILLFSVRADLRVWSARHRSWSSEGSTVLPAGQPVTLGDDGALRIEDEPGCAYVVTESFNPATDLCTHEQWVLSEEYAEAEEAREMAQGERSAA